MRQMKNTKYENNKAMNNKSHRLDQGPTNPNRLHLFLHAWTIGLIEKSKIKIKTRTLGFSLEIEF